ncbi:MAG: transglycosylase domain-containing protein [Prevotellaceae bacterium]|nr:transglycosylase domain-containing protein [Prevotellaceae bacterium]
MTKSKRKKNIIRLIWGVILFPVALLALTIGLINLGVFGKMPTFEDLENPQSKLATIIYAEDFKESKGKSQVKDDDKEPNVVLGTFHLENRSHVDYKYLSPYLVKALIATEDVRFTNHSGIDFRGLGRVLVKTVLGGNRRAGGGSTISQQLALNLFAEREQNILKRSIQKLQEWITAVKLERNYTKSEIVAMYFNTVPFGSNAYGISSAAQTFFGKSPSELNLEESALMVGVVNAPSKYSPVRNPEQSKERRDLVLGQMCKYGYISKQEYDSVREIPIKLNYRPIDHNSGLATYFREMLRQTMKMKKPDPANYQFKTKEDFSADSMRWETDPLYGWCNKNLKNGVPYDLDRDGLRIYTTINSRMQRYAENAVEEHLAITLQPQFNTQKKVRKHFPFSNYAKESTIEESIERAIRSSDRYRSMKKSGMVEDSIRRSFEIKTPMTVFAWRKGKRSSTDTLMSPRDSILYYKSLIRTAFMAMEPGTGKIKAYVGGPDFRYFKFDNAWQGRRQIGSTVKPFLYTLAIQEGKTPCTKIPNVRKVIRLPNGEAWSPESTENEKYKGVEITLKLALALSSNNISAQLVEEIGPETLAETCRQFGLTSHIDPVHSLALGSADMSPYEMVAAYNTFPSGGFHVNPYFVTRITDNQGNLLATFTQSKREVIGKRIAYLIVNLMQGVVNGGTGTRARQYVPSAELAGKTGTTDKNADGWFIGYLPKLTAGVWVGNEDRGVTLLGDGARMALPIWGLFMKKVMSDKSLGISAEDKFEIPAGIDRASLNCSENEDENSESDEPDSLFF